MKSFINDMKEKRLFIHENEILYEKSSMFFLIFPKRWDALADSLRKTDFFLHFPQGFVGKVLCFFPIVFNDRIQIIFVSA